MLKQRTAAGDEFVLILETLREPIEERRTWWPRYITGLYAHYKVPIILAVFCHDDVTAAWASRPITIGMGFWTSCEVRPIVFGPHNIPEQFSWMIGLTAPESSAAGT